MLAGLSNYEVFAVASVFDITEFNTWKSNQENYQKQQPQKLDTTVYENSYTNSYTNVPYANSYSNQPAQDTYTNIPSKDKYTNIPGEDSYTDVPYTNTYSNIPYENSYTNTPAQDHYANTPAENSYTNIPSEDHYANVTGVDDYTNQPHIDIYSDVYEDQYTNSPWQEYTDGGVSGDPSWTDSYSDGWYSDSNQWSEIPHVDSYTNSQVTDHYAAFPELDSYTNIPGQNEYTNVPGEDSYANSPGEDEYTNIPVENSYTNTPGQDNYTNVPEEDSYTNIPYEDNYSNRPYEDSYSNSLRVDTYTNTPYEDSYSNVTTDKGFDHVNYIPFKPGIYGVSPSETCRGIITIGFYSHDRNSMGYGTQTAQARDVKYSVFIKRKNEPDSAYTLLAGDFTANTYDFDTRTRPDGEYVIKVIAKNDPIALKGVTKQYISDEAVIDIILKQNSSPVITVKNGNEFIKFTFSKSGAETSNNLYTSYNQHLYQSNYAKNWGQEEGIFVKMEMIDADAGQWQKGTVQLFKPDGQIIHTAEIHWSNIDSVRGSTNVSSSNTYKTGYGYIPGSILPGDTELTNCRVRIIVTDYEDEACTIPLGSTTVLDKVSQSGADTRVLNVNIDTLAPTVTTTNTDYSFKANDISVPLSYQDGLSGLLIKEYAVTSNTNRPSIGWKQYSSPVVISNNGSYYVHYHAVDNAGNERYGWFGPYRLDKSNPVVTADNTNYEWKNSDVSINLNFSDTDSGISQKKYAVTANTNVPATWNTYTSSIKLSVSGEYYVHYMAVNNAGRSTTGYFGPYKLDKYSPVINCSVQQSSEKADAVVTVADSGGSRLSVIEYAWSKSENMPISWNTLNAAEQESYIFNTSVDQDGRWYLHIRAVDVAGNTAYVYKGSYAIALVEAYNFRITMIQDSGWRGYYFDLSNGIDTNGDGTVDRYPRRSNTDIYTTQMPVNEHGFISNPSNSVKAGSKIKGSIDVKGNPDSFIFTVKYLKNGVACSENVIPVNSGGALYSFEWNAPLDIDQDTYVVFGVNLSKQGRSYGNERWKDVWAPGNIYYLVLYINGNCTDDLVFHQTY